MKHTIDFPAEYLRLWKTPQNSHEAYHKLQCLQMLDEMRGSRQFNAHGTQRTGTDADAVRADRHYPGWRSVL